MPLLFHVASNAIASFVYICETALQTDILFEGKSLTPDILLVTTSVYDGLVLRGSSLSSLLA